MACSVCGARRCSSSVPGSSREAAKYSTEHPHGTDDTTHCGAELYPALRQLSGSSGSSHGILCNDSAIVQYHDSGYAPGYSFVVLFSGVCTAGATLSRG